MVTIGNDAFKVKTVFLSPPVCDDDDDDDGNDDDDDDSRSLFDL